MKLQNKSALVTGASRGIGRGIAVKLASEGAKIAVNFNSDEKSALEVVAQIEAAGGQAFAVRGSIADLAAIDSVVSEVENRFGKLDILVNNAGIGEFVAFEDASVEHFDKQFDLNVRGLFFLTQRALRSMNDGGRIINISSISSRGLSIDGAAYSATKAAVNAFTSALSKGLGERGITVNAVSPGLIETDLALASFSAEDIERMSKGSAFGRIGKVEDVADILAFLASDDARWITGREIVADGGTI
ncbi:MAG TPA: glucose 1-dehydrogenase [Abditibacterium sp.]|jgi:3-oxoacyl-[acyl-carrier protein] reductase